MLKPVISRIFTGCALAAASVSGATGVAHAAGQARPGRPARLARPANAVSAAPAGRNLLGNAGAQTGAVSAHGWDSVTIPGWTISRGLPTVVRYGTRGFPAASGPFPARPGGQLFAGGTGGTTVLRQLVRLRTPRGGLLPPGTSYQLSGWLGATKSSRASVTVQFVAAGGQSLGHATIGPVGLVGTLTKRGLARRATTGTLPAGTESVQVDLRLATALKNFDGENGVVDGYNRAIADDLRFSVGTSVSRPAPIRPPVARVPHYQHVFLFYFENQDFRDIIGNTAQAPYFNRLLPRSSLLANLYAEEHPSDANYLALAGGSTFGVPLDDPAEENPLYTIHARNLADLLGAAHQSWKAYLQSAAGPCDDTVHNQYWDDDQPMMYFADVRNRPAYCASHVVPLESLTADLARKATTPAFSWISPDDCFDMEGCGIKAGDEFLADELGAIMASPAWRRQRSLAIITFDEDNYDHPRPPQRVPTIMIGSTGVRRGYVSKVRYTHYSLLRTIEAALGLGRLTANDRYAAPVNDVFSAQAWPVRGPATPPAAGVRLEAAATRPALRSAKNVALPSAATDPLAFVANSGSASVTPVDLRSRKAGKPIGVGSDPAAIVAAPNGRTVYVASSGPGTVTPINTTTLRAGRPIRVGAEPRALAMTPDGRTLYVANSGSGTVTPISTGTGRAGTPIKVGAEPRAIELVPGRPQALVLDWSGQVTPINTRTNRAGRPIKVGGYPVALSFAPGGQTGYVASFGSDTVTPIAVRSGRAGPAIPVGQAPDALAVSKDGTKVFVVNGDSRWVSVISVKTGRVSGRIKVGYSPAAVILSRSGATGYVVNTVSGTVSRFATATGRLTKALGVGLYSYPLAMSQSRSGKLGIVIDTYGGQVSLIDTATGRVFPRITVGAFPVAVALVRD
jgi:YVTN family beta-propeller protein